MFKRLKETILEIIQQADLILLGLCCAASVFGIAMIYSATRYNNDNRKIIVQAAALLIGIVVYFGISMIDLEMLIKRWKWIAAFDVLFILLLKTPFGVSDNTGNTAWLKFPFLPVSIGPAEVVKITFIILLAWQLQWLREEKRDLRSFSAAFYVGGHTLGIAGLYFVISGDMGNALMFLLIFVVMSFVAGFALRWFALLFGASGAVIGGIIAFDLVPDSKKYMLNRFIVLFDHSYDVQGSGLAADPKPADHRRRRLLGTGVSPRHPVSGGGRLRSGPAHGPDFRRHWGGTGVCGSHAVDLAAGGHHHPGTGGGPAGCPAVPHLRLRGHRLYGDVSNDHQHRYVPVHHAGDRPDAAVFQLRWLVGGDAVRRHGLRLRHQKADGGPPPSGTALRLQRGILTENRGAQRSGFFHRARSHIFPALRQHYLCINTVYPN